MARVLVSGGAGFLGSHLVDRLLQRPDVERVVAVDSLWTGSWDNLAHIDDPRLERVTANIEDYHTSSRFEEVLHLASPASPKWYLQNPGATVSANVGGALRLRHLLVPGGRFCFTTTSEVYGSPDVSPQPESYQGRADCTGPRAAYHESKRCVEALLMNWARVEDLDVRIARIFNAYGERTSSDDGRAISNFISRGLLGQPLQIYGDGQQTRSWGYVADIVEGLSRYFWDHSVNFMGPLNIGNDREASVLDTALYIQQLIPGATIEFKPPVPQDPSNRRPDLTLARKVLSGWTCQTSYEEGILSTLDWFRRNLHKLASEAGLRSRGDALPPDSSGEHASN